MFASSAWPLQVWRALSKSTYYRNIRCSKTACSKRHPKVCRFFSISGSCKFNDSCSYLHKHGHSEKTKKLEKELENLKEDIKILTKEVDNLKEVISSLSKASSPPNSVTLQGCQYRFWHGGGTVPPIGGGTRVRWWGIGA